MKRRRLVSTHLTMENEKTLELIKAAAIEPWKTLGRKLAEQRVLELADSDEARECSHLASEIVRLAGEFGFDSRDMARRSNDWALIAATAESGRVRLLSSAAKRLKLSAAACFEADGLGKYRFIQNRVTIDHPTLGSANLMTTAAAAIQFLLAELGLDAGWKAEIPEGPMTFSPTVVLDAGPDKTRVFKGVQIQFYKRNEAGEFVRYQPGDWQLELKTSV